MNCEYLARTQEDKRKKGPIRQKKKQEKARTPEPKIEKQNT
jgi:hypothetical protein